MPAAKKRPSLALATDAQQILDAQDLREEIVEVPEWNCAVKVRGFSLKTQQDVMDQAMVGGEFDDNRHSALLLIHGIVEPAFTPDQAELLRHKSLAATNRVVAALNRCNGAEDGAVASAEATFHAE